MTDLYSRACTEVLVLLRAYLPEDDYQKIPQEKIDFLEKNKAENYEYAIDKTLPLEEQEISEKAHAILITIYRDYFADGKQKRLLEAILRDNDIILEEQKSLADTRPAHYKRISEQIIEILKNTNEIRLDIMFSDTENE